MGAMNFMMIAAVIALVAFVYRYVRYSPWNQYLQGRLLLVQKIAFIVLFTHLIVKDLWRYPGWEIVEYTVAVALLILFWAMFLALVEAQAVKSPAPKEYRGILADEDIEKTNPKLRGRKK